MFPNTDCVDCPPCPPAIPAVPIPDLSHVCGNEYDLSCVVYTGENIPCLGITKGMMMDEILSIFNPTLATCRCCKPIPVPVVNCVVSDWGPWTPPEPGDCVTDGPTTTCTQTRTRTVITPASGGGTPCPVLTETRCRPVNCVGDYLFTPCDPATGKRTGTFIVFTPDNCGGTPCPPLTKIEDCTPNVNCVVTWGAPSPCTGGYTTEIGTITTPQSGTGTICPPLTRITPCTPPPRCAPVTAVGSRIITPSPCIRPIGLTKGQFLTAFKPSGASPCPSISYDIQNAPSLAAACTIWGEFKKCVCPSFIGTYNLFQIEYFSLTVGQKVYVLWGNTTCAPIPVGRYFFMNTTNTSPTAYFCPLNVVTIVTIGVDGIITSIDTCTCARPTGLISARFLASFTTVDASAGGPCESQIYDIQHAPNLITVCSYFTSLKTCGCPTYINQTTFFNVQYESLTVGKVAYYGITSFGVPVTDCNIIPNGKYFLWNSLVGNSAANYFCPLTAITVITIGNNNGTITAIENCSYLP